MRRLFRVLLSISLVLSLFSKGLWAEDSAPSVDAAVTTNFSITSSRPGEEILFTARFKDPDGYENLHWGSLRFWPTIDTNQLRRFDLMYVLTSNKLYLRDYEARKWVGPFSPGSDGIVENDYASLSCARTTVSGEGNTLTVTFAITFKEPAADEVYQMRLQVRDLTEAIVGLIDAGTWKVEEKIPRIIRFQGKLGDVNKESLNGSFTLTFRLYDVETGGIPLWEETQIQEIENGLLDVELGNTTPLDLPFDKQYWLGVEVESDGEMQPRFKLTSVPYAIESD